MTTRSLTAKSKSSTIEMTSRQTKVPATERTKSLSATGSNNRPV